MIILDRILTFLSVVLMLAFLVTVLSACETVHKTETPTVQTPTPTPEIRPSRVYTTWEKGHPERQPWTDFLMKEAYENENFFFMAKDISDFCPKYNHITRTQRAKAISEIVIAMAFYESSWNPNTYFPEPTSHFTKPDLVTGKPVASEGLLQLSYQDTRFGPYKSFCTFDYRSNIKAIQNPIENLRCGFGILKHLVTQNKVISGQFMHEGKTVYTGGARYWSVLRQQKHRTDIIKRVIAAMPECK